MKISIVTISFNQGEYIKHAFASIAQQAFLQLEYIVVDPGSTDASRAHIDEAHSLISTKILSPDKGPADGLNKGFSLATGEIFGFLNADDVLMPGALVTIEKFFQTHPDVDVVSGHAKIIGADGGFIRLAFSEPFNLRMYAFGCCITMQPSTFFRASAFKRAGGFRTENRTNWDGELWVDMALSGCKFAVINEILSGYRLQPNSITSSAKLDSAIKQYRRYISSKILGRSYRPFDKVEGYFWRVIKHLRDPRALWERISRGPIYGRSS